jgi:spore photoproduct lyase
MKRAQLNYRDGKEEVELIPKKGEVMGRCATFNRKYICCSVHVLKSIHNCPFECSYCFLQNYLNDGITKVVNDEEGLIEEVKEKTRVDPWRLFRIGTWELGDSLALEGEKGQAAQLVERFARLDNAVLELKTKSASVDTLLGLHHNGRTVVSWSLNTEYVIETEELRTSSLDERLQAMHKIAKAGYIIGLHFDPMIFYPGWEEGYKRLVKQVFKAVNPDRVAWISIGSLRFNPEMKKKIENNYPENRLTCAAMVLGDDLKMRYVKPQRIAMYTYLFSLLSEYVNADNLLYLCMERWDVWERVFGYCPDSVGHLDYLFARSLYERYGLGSESPQMELYEEANRERMNDYE